MDATIVRANPFALGTLVLDSLQVAVGHVDDTVARLEQLVAVHGSGGLDDVAKAATKDARLGAFRVNKEAQARLTPLFDGAEASSIDDTARARIKNADKHLEDSGWQLQNKVAPDGRFAGIDLGGALRDARTAADILREIVR